MQEAQKYNWSVVFKKVSRIFASLSFVIGALVIVGYLTHNQSLKSIFPGLVSMNPTTAFAFMCGSVSLLCFDRVGVKYRIIGITTASIVFLIGFVKLYGIILGADVYFDHIVFQSQLNDLVTGFKNRIAPNTAINFALSGISLLLLHLRKKITVAQSLSLVTFFIALLAVLGYLYGVKNLTGFIRYIPMALNTGIAFLCLSFAIFVSLPEMGIAKTLSNNGAGGVLARRLIPISIFVPATLGYLRIVSEHSLGIPISLGLALVIIGNIVVFSATVLILASSLRVVDDERTAANERLKEFISLAAHQLKTPPGIIQWNMELLLAGDIGVITKEQREILETTNGVSRQMTETVNALLNVSRLDTKTFIVNPEPVAVDTLVQNVFEELKLKVSEKNITVTKDFITALPRIPLDVGLMRIVFQNLISNAVKYTPEKGSVSLHIAPETREGERGILCTVSDTGYGIPLTEQSKIFDKMFRASNVKNTVDGTGFGLYLVKSITEIAHGSIWFESTENKGTTFYVFLPLRGMDKKEGKSKLTSVGI